MQVGYPSSRKVATKSQNFLASYINSSRSFNSSKFLIFEETEADSPEIPEGFEPSEIEVLHLGFPFSCLNLLGF